MTAADYTRGPVAAKIQIVTFSDFECPFCKTFHGTLNAILAKYPTVSATYRHYPLEQLHPNAMQLSVAAECVGLLGGDAAFWKFVDSSFASREVNAKTQMSRLPEFATSAGVASSAYTSCIAGAAAKNAVNADIADGTKASISGTPNSFIFKNGVKVDTILGSQPLSVVEAKIAKLLN